MPDTAQSQDTSNDAGQDRPADAPTSKQDSTADLASIASNLAGTMPEVQEHAVAEAEKQRQDATDAPVDKSGARFDPAVHAVGSDGKPTVTTRGSFALKRGRKAGGSNAATGGANARSVANGGSSLGGVTKPADAQKAVAAAQARASGEGAAELLFMAGRIVGGEEWLPQKDEKTGLDERGMMRGAFGDYFVSTNKQDVPPGVVLGFAILAYMTPRFAMPKTRARFGGIKSRLTQWWINRRLRKQGLTAEVRATPVTPETARGGTFGM